MRERKGKQGRFSIVSLTFHFLSLFSLLFVSLFFFLPPCDSERGSLSEL